MSRKKRCLTLLEIVIAITLMGILLAGLFNCLQQGLKKKMIATALKQKILHLELFQQHLKNLFSNLDPAELSLEKHPDASGLSLSASFKQTLDSEFISGGNVRRMLFLNKNKELCLVNWPQIGKASIEILLDKVDSFKCRLFDPKKGEWTENWSKKKEENPVMISIDLKWEGKEIPFVFFLRSSNEPITYEGMP